MKQDAVPLPRANGWLETAKQCRKMGLIVGDTIVGRECYVGGWNEARLTLLFLGKEVAVWKEMRRSDRRPKWRVSGESANWTLSNRRWFVVQRAKKDEE